MWTSIRIALAGLTLLSGTTASWGQTHPPRAGDLARIPASSSGTISPGNAAGNPGGNPMPAIRGDRWAEAEALVARHPDPVARKLAVYYRLLSPAGGSAAEIASFMAQNPDWPSQPLLERRRQEALAIEPDDSTAVSQCGAAPPTQAAALLRCAAALADTGHASNAAAVARNAWIEAVAEPTHEAQFLRRWASLPSADDEWQRFQRLAWRDTDAAARQVSRLDPTRRAVAEVRLALKRDDPTANGRFNALAATWRTDPGMMLDRARFLRRQNRMAEAVALWLEAGTNAQAAAPTRLGDFWSERHLMTRRLMQEGTPKDAYALVAAHGQNAIDVVLEAEFLAGFIALRMMKDPARAAPHFSTLDRTSKSAITQGRAHYWLGRAAEAAGEDGTPHYRRSAAWSTTFYGQMAALRLGEDRPTRNARILEPRDPTWDQEMVLGYGGREVVRAAAWLIAWGEAPRARAFLLRMDDLAPVPADRSLTAAFALRVGLPDTAVFVARRIGRDGGMLTEAGWPMPFEPPSDFDASVALGIMRQESSFDLGAVSSSGARGLMQLMPFTARDVAKKLGIPTSLPALTLDTGHNMRLGTTYLAEMLARFGGSLPLAVAAYNAGPSRVDRWLADNGDPRTGDPAMLDWIERIPYNETRNYVQRVLENVVVYRAKRGDPTETLSLDWADIRR